MKQPLLVELGTDELPVQALPGLAQALFDGVVAGLAKRGIAVDVGDAKPLYTPRRLAVLLPGVATLQPERQSEVFGPYVDIALDADGQPTRALQGFAAKAGVDWTELQKTTDAKGERFVHRATTPGALTLELLPEIVAEAVAAMPIPKPMRWGAHAHAFARPVHWLVMLLGDSVASGSVLGVQAGRHSRGHRFMHGGPVAIARPDQYVQSLRDARVLVDADERRARIEQALHAAVDGLQGDAIPSALRARVDAGNLEQVNNLVEWPVAIACAFDREYLDVPAEALVATMEANQKYFPVLDGDGRLTEHFIGIANIESRDPAQVRKGYERVIRPRFADAKFFFDEDLKQGLAEMGQGLAAVTYQAKLGSIADKVARVAELADAVASQAGEDPQLARRAAGLAKNDLQSRMVGEFPELQGVAGRHYARHAGEMAEVSAALDEAYMPRNAGDGIAPSRLGQVLAIAERIDTLAGGFAAGLKPSGSKDPFALRRNALGLARTIVEGGLELDLPALLQQATRTVAHAGSVDAGELYDFILDRLRGYYQEQGFAPQAFEAVAALRPASLVDFDARLRSVSEFARMPEAVALAAANKRIGNILRKAGTDAGEAVDPTLLHEPAERALAEALAAAIADTDGDIARRDYVGVLERLARLRPEIDRFFDDVMVNAEVPAIRVNRLALLRRLSTRLGSVAAIEHLSA